MARRPTIEERMDALGALRDEPHETSWPELRKALGTKTGLIIATAVDVLASAGALDSHANDVSAAMVAAFGRLCEDAVRRDPGCRGKLAIAAALADASVWEEDVFAAGLRWVQPEPVWGGQQDTAADLRGACALAYAELLHPDAVTVLATTLADPERAARAAAAVALGNSGRLEAIPLLRYKATIGDDDGEVHAATLRALLVLDPEESLGFVGAFLSSPVASAAESAALALGESRHADALALLRPWALAELDGDPRRAEVGFVALAMLRSDAANEILLETIEAGETSDAAAAVRALAPYGASTELRERLRAAAQAHGSEIAELADAELERLGHERA